MHHSDIEKLVEQYLDGAITPGDEEILMAWYHSQADEELSWLLEETDTEATIKQRIFSKVMEHVKGQQVSSPDWRFWYYSAAAAVIAAVLVFGLLFIRLPSEQLPLSKIKKTWYKNDVPAGSNKATLLLANGTRVVLDDVKKGTIGHQEGVVIDKTGNGQLAYSDRHTHEAGLQYNEISTPKGGQYQLILSDGTKVWLNAATNLKFPVAFNGATREVQLDGEAYFEVAKNRNKPFKVLVNKSQVIVLGTHFNVSGYNSDNHTTTTLLEGSVQINDGSTHSILKPGQKAQLNNTSRTLSIANTDAEEAVAWKNGYFLFVNEDVKSIMQKLSRWYNIEVYYEGDVSNKALFGTMSRYKNISEVLNMLELTGVIKFKIEGRRVTVMP